MYSRTWSVCKYTTFLPFTSSHHSQQQIDENNDNVKCRENEIAAKKKVTRFLPDFLIQAYTLSSSILHMPGGVLLSSWLLSDERLCMPGGELLSCRLPSDEYMPGGVAARICTLEFSIEVGAARLRKF
jgi:hypothetical protein